MSKAGQSARVPRTTPNDLYRGPKYSEVLEFLCSECNGPANLKVLVSEPGLGKTSLLRAALETMQPRVRSSFLFWTQLEPSEFVNYLLLSMGIANPSAALDTARQQVEEALQRAAHAGKRFVLAVDEAQNLSPTALDRIATLFDGPVARTSQLQVIFSGQEQLRSRIADPEASRMRARIARVMSLCPLTDHEVAEYIAQRFPELAGSTAVPHIIAESGGIPRIIDRLCDELLNRDSAYAGQDESISVRIASLGATSRGSAQFVPLTRPSGAAATTGHTSASVARISEWFARQPCAWSGTAAELAVATGEPVEGISRTIETAAEQLRNAGVLATVQRGRGKLPIITVRRATKIA